jgi:UDP:flavonoid glycosyltransferase YjiC (YdhE family)
MLLIPLGADQPLNAARCAALGVARTLDPLDATPADVAAAATAVLGEPAYRRAAAALRDEIAAMPEVEAAVALLERL